MISHDLERPHSVREVDQGVDLRVGSAVLEMTPTAAPEPVPGRSATSGPPRTGFLVRRLTGWAAIAAKQAIEEA